MSDINTSETGSTPAYQTFPDIEELQASGDVIQSEEDGKRIMRYAVDEFDKITSGEERKEMEEKWETWRRQREAQPKEKEKSYPWPGASNVSPPLAMMNGNGIYALLKNTLGAKKPFYHALSHRDEDQRTAKALQNLLDIMVESPDHLNMRNVNNTILYELATLGTQFVKVPWIIDRWTFKRRGAGGATEQVNKIRKDSPGVIPVRLEDFICRPFYQDIQRAPMIGQRIYLFEHELLQRGANGIYQNVDEVIKGGSIKELDQAKRDQLDRMGITPDEARDMKLYQIAELYLYDDIDGDGIPEDIIIWIDPVTETFLRAEYNDLGIRPWVRIPYLDRPHELYAIGTGWMSQHMQDEIESLHNMRVDGTHLGSLQMYITRRGSGIGPGYRFRPLSNIQVENPREDFIPIKFPDIGYTTVQAELLAKEYADRATGASDAMMGFASKSQGTRQTASGTMFLAQQGSKMFNAIQESVQAGYSEVARVIAFQMIRNGDRSRESLLPLLSTEDQQAIQPIFEMNVEDIPSKFTFQVHTTDAENTEEAKKQNMLTLTQLYTMYGEKILQLLPMVYSPQAQVPPEIQEVAAKFFVGSTKLMDQIFKSFGEADTGDFLPFVRNIEMMLENIDAVKRQQMQNTRSQGANNVETDTGNVGPVGGGGQNYQGLSDQPRLGGSQGPPGNGNSGSGGGPA